MVEPTDLLRGWRTQIRTTGEPDLMEMRVLLQNFKGSVCNRTGPCGEGVVEALVSLQLQVEVRPSHLPPSMRRASARTAKMKRKPSERKQLLFKVE